MIFLNDFSGGLNLRDSATEIAPNETPDALNWTLDTRGQTKLRKGCLNVVALPGTSGTAAFIYHSGALSQWLCARTSGGALHLFTRPGDLSGVWTDRGTIHTMPNGIPAFAAFVDFPGNPPKVVLTSAQIGAVSFAGAVYTWDGTTLTSVSGTIGGTAIALWQNRVWIGGYPLSDANGNLTRLFASKVGDPATWAAPDGLTVDVRDKDASGLTALGIAGGALVVFKKRSTYRVNDSATGSYTTIDASLGCIGPLAAPGSRGRLYVWGADGLYESDGIGSLKNVGDKVRPLFATDPALIGGVPALCGGQIEDRLLFAYPHSAGGNNDRLLEYDPTHGWLMRHQLASTSKDEITSFARKEGDLYAACMDGDIMLKVFSEIAGADDGTLFSNNFRTPWLQPGRGKIARIIRAQVEGLTVTGGTTTLTMNVYTDWDLSAASLSLDLSADLRGGDSSDQVETSIQHSLGHSRAFAFEFVAGTAAGAAQINSLSFDPIPIEA